MTAPLNIGLLGCGVIAQRTLRGLEDILLTYNGCIVAVCSPSEKSRNAIINGVIHSPASDVTAYTSYADMLAEPSLDAIIIATPINLHYGQVRQALLANKHVYCHKTLAASTEQCIELQALAETRGLTLAVSPGQILLPAYTRAQEIVNNGELGDIVSVDAATEASPHRYEGERAEEAPAPGEHYSWEWYHQESQGGGPLADMFVYPLAFLTELLGDATGASARSRLVEPEITWKGITVIADTPDVYLGSLAFSEIIATFRASFSTNSQKQPWGLISIRGTRACLDIEKCHDALYKIYITPNDGEAYQETHTVFSQEIAHKRGERECHVLTDIEEFIRAIRQGRPIQGATAQNAARVVNAITLIKQSAKEEGRWVA